MVPPVPRSMMSWPPPTQLVAMLMPAVKLLTPAVPWIVTVLPAVSYFEHNAL